MFFVFLFDSLQLIKVFNEDISRAMYGKESWFGNDIRLFPKIRREFHTWGVKVLESSAKGKHRKSERFHPLAFTLRDNIINMLLFKNNNNNNNLGGDEICSNVLVTHWPLGTERPSLCKSLSLQRDHLTSPKKSNKIKTSFGRELTADSLNYSSK